MDFQLDTGLKFGFTCPDDHEDFQNLIAKSEPLIRSKNHHSGGSCGVDEISHSEDDENLVENDSKLDLATHMSIQRQVALKLRTKLQSQSPFYPEPPVQIRKNVPETIEYNHRQKPNPPQALPQPQSQIAPKPQPKPVPSRINNGYVPSIQPTPVLHHQNSNPISNRNLNPQNNFNHHPPSQYTANGNVTVQPYDPHNSGVNTFNLNKNTNNNFKNSNHNQNHNLMNHSINNQSNHNQLGNNHSGNHLNHAGNHTNHLMHNSNNNHSNHSTHGSHGNHASHSHSHSHSNHNNHNNSPSYNKIGNKNFNGPPGLEKSHLSHTSHHSSHNNNHNNSPSNRTITPKPGQIIGNPLHNANTYDHDYFEEDQLNIIKQVTEKIGETPNQVNNLPTMQSVARAEVVEESKKVDEVETSKIATFEPQKSKSSHPSSKASKHVSNLPDKNSNLQNQKPKPQTSVPSHKTTISSQHQPKPILPQPIPQQTKPAGISWASRLQAKNKENSNTHKKSDKRGDPTPNGSLSPRDLTSPSISDVNESIPSSSVTSHNVTFNPDLAAKLHNKNLEYSSNQQPNIEKFGESSEYKLSKDLTNWFRSNSSSLSVGQHYIPHGFKNPGQNNCFINCVIQALFACRPFVNLLRQMSFGSNLNTPYHNALKGILENFKPWDKEAKKWANREFETNGPNSEVIISDKIQNDGVSKADTGSTAGNKNTSSSTTHSIGQFQNKNSSSSIDAKERLKHMLIKADMDDGMQHDAQEFLSSLLNELNDEYNQVLKNLAKFEELSSKEETNSAPASNPTVNSTWGAKANLASIVSQPKPAAGSSANQNGPISDEWTSVQTKNSKKIQQRLEPQEISRTQTEVSPISKMFTGMNYIFYVENKSVRNEKTGQKKITNTTLRATSEPFLSFPVNFLDPNFQKTQFYTKYDNILEALSAQAQPETIEGYVHNGNKLNTVLKHELLEHLPPILILHVNNMGYDLSSGESMKIQFKNDLDVPNILEFPDECMKSNVIKDFESQVKPKYALFAIIYHHGQKARTGHYTCEVKVANSWWCNCDDEKITLMQNRQKKSFGQKTPYLLMYMNENDIRK